MDSYFITYCTQDEFDGMDILGDFAYELALPYLVVYAEVGQKADVIVSADPYITFPSANFLTSKGIKVA